MNEAYEKLLVGFSTLTFVSLLDTTNESQLLRNVVGVILLILTIYVKLKDLSEKR